MTTDFRRHALPSARRPPVPTVLQDEHANAPEAVPTTAMFVERSEARENGSCSAEHLGPRRPVSVGCALEVRAPLPREGQSRSEEHADGGRW